MNLISELTVQSYDTISTLLPSLNNWNNPHSIQALTHARQAFYPLATPSLSIQLKSNPMLLAYLSECRGLIF
jgi:hypothetical protein